MSNPSRFLLDEPLTRPGEYTLNREESHHAASVLRHKAGDAIVVFDGLGNYAEAVVAAADRSGVRVAVDGVHVEKHLPLKLTIATAIPKGKRWQVLVEKCTELGVDRIIPMLTDRGVAKGEGDAAKWRRWVIEAAKQSRRARLPEITQPVPFADIPSMARDDQALLLIADPEGENPNEYRDMLGHVLETVVMVGPEGGFTEAELESLRRAGGRTIRLSPFILRVETAAAVVCAVVREVLM